jgi:phosphoserine phosphatase RsbU/P
VGHGLHAARRAAFVRTAFAATAPYSDHPRKLLGWANAALVERAGAGFDFVTAACVTYLPGDQLLRWAYAGHPPALALPDGHELAAPSQGIPLGIADEPDYAEGSLRSEETAGLLLYTDGLTEARRQGEVFGLDRVTAALGELDDPTASEAVECLRTLVCDFAAGSLSDDLCLLAARIDG